MKNFKQDEIHLWFAFPEYITAPDLLATYKKLLTAEEKSRQQHFHFPKHRHQYLITRVLVRTVLSRYLDVQPSALRFWKNKYGRPEIGSRSDLPLRFNLSNTDGLIVCAVVRKGDIGVDVESMTRSAATMEIVKRYFSPQEISAFQTIPKEKRQEFFLQYWTLKESYIKARGMGLALPLDQFSFHLPGKENLLRLSFDPRLEDDPVFWTCLLLQPAESHYMALSIRSDSQRLFKLIMKKIVPLHEEEYFQCPILYQTA